MCLVANHVYVNTLPRKCTPLLPFSHQWERTFTFACAARLREMSKSGALPFTHAVLAEERQQPAAAAAGGQDQQAGSSSSSKQQQQPRDPTKDLFYPDGLLLPGWIIKVSSWSLNIAVMLHSSSR
jgi:hypothetical protein